MFNTSILTNKSWNFNIFDKFVNFFLTFYVIKFFTVVIFKFLETYPIIKKRQLIVVFDQVPPLLSDTSFG